MGFTIKIKRWHGVAAWTWNAGDDVCGICRSPYDSCPPDGKYPGDDSPVVWGACCHAFHIQCIQKWLASSSEQRCPLCRRGWEYKSAAEPGLDAVGSPAEPGAGTGAAAAPQLSQGGRAGEAGGQGGAVNPAGGQPDDMEDSDLEPGMGHPSPAATSPAMLSGPPSAAATARLSAMGLLAASLSGSPASPLMSLPSASMPSTPGSQPSWQSPQLPHRLSASHAMTRTQGFGSGQAVEMPNIECDSDMSEGSEGSRTISMSPM
ncbi:anaphase-promoting complex subunit 11 RING-H2 finger-domain-containing protein [Haematococcus lacustris]|nr:hypothetical protein QJQ45_011493 [Haematococcus lacustris]